MNRIGIRTLIGVVVGIVIAVVAIWQGYLPLAELKGWWPYQPLVDVRIIAVQFNAPGTDSKDNLKGEWIQIKNTGSTKVEMSGWMLCDYGEKHHYRFGDFTLPANGTVKIYSGSGTDSQTELYWGSGRHIWNNDGDTATLLNSDGEYIHDFTE